MTLQKFVSHHTYLLNKERDTEIDETRILTEKLPVRELQRRGVCLLKLQISGRHTGMYGRTVITFQPSGQLQELPSNNMSSGDIVGLSLSSSNSSNEELGSGIVTKVSQSSISVAFDENQELFSLDDDSNYKLMKLANDVTYKRLKRALSDLENVNTGPTSHLVAVLFGETELSAPHLMKEIHFVNTNLDDSQRDAVNFSLSQPEVAIVHGPPGTGKTTTVIEIIVQAVKQGKKILACAPSNIAVDNLLERLIRYKQKAIRLGHPARILPHVQKYCLDALLSNSDETKLVEDVRQDLDKSLSKLRKTRDRGEKQKLREDMKFLRKELMQREEAATREILKHADIVLSTLTSASRDGPLKLLDEGHFDLTIIDECSQAVEAACWIPLMMSPRCILAGDHLQLPPTILSTKAAKAGLEVTLMERLISVYNEKIVRMLTTQYRMHHLIMEWSSKTLYDGKLKADDSVKDHLLKHIPEVEDCEETNEPLLLIDTAGCQLYELDMPEEMSKGNEGEADIVSCHVEKLISHGLKPEDIAVIAPYNLQVELLRLRLSPKYPKLEIKSVDGFQGREKEAVVISLVRSNPKGEVGFLAEKRRINVAVTRARRHLAVICDSETVGHDEFLKSLVDYMGAHGEVTTAEEFIQAGNVNKDIVRPDHLSDLLTLSTTTKTSNQGKGARPKSNTNHKERKNKHTESTTKEKRQHHSNQQDKNHRDEGEVDKKIQEFQDYLDDFVADLEQDYLEFSPELNSHERFLVHELAEKMGLTHVSRGVDEQRHIVVSKPGVKIKSEVLREETTQQPAEVDNKNGKNTSKKLNDNKNKERNGNLDKLQENIPPIINQNEMPEIDPSENQEIRKSDPPKASHKINCRHCNKDVIKANIDLHEIHCAKQQKDRAKSAQGLKPDSSHKNVSKKTHNQNSAAVAKLQKIDNDDFDALINAAQKIDRACSFKKCKTKISTLGQVCEFCLGVYCLTHHMPEIHGCGDAAKAQARTTIKGGVLYRGSGVPDRLPDADRKAHLQKKLDKKLTDMSAQRNKKKPKK